MYDVFVWPFRLPLSLSVSLTMATFFGGLSVFQRLDPHGGLSPASFKLLVGLRRNDLDWFAAGFYRLALFENSAVTITVVSSWSSVCRLMGSASLICAVGALVFDVFAAIRLPQSGCVGERSRLLELDCRV